MLDVCREKVIWQFVLLYFFDRLLENTVFLLDCFILSKSIRCLQCLAQRVFTQSELEDVMLVVLDVSITLKSAQESITLCD